VDDSLRALERAAIAEPGDDAAACAFLAALARATDELPVVEPIVHGDLSLLGPLLGREATRIRSLDPAAIHVDRIGTGWLHATNQRGPALFAATLRLRLLQLDHLAHEPASGFVPWAFHAAIDHDRDVAIERLTRVLATGEPHAADRVATLLAARSEPAIGRDLARLACALPSECRPRLYKALALGVVPIDPIARDLLRQAIGREEAVVQEEAFAALRRGATEDDLERDRTSGPPAIRGAAFKTLIQNAPRSRCEELIRHALVDEEARVHRAALDVLATPEWFKHPRLGEWAMSRLLDKDRAVRHAALKLVQRFALPARQLPRLRLIVEEAPPGIRPTLERLLEHHERRAR
jgi:hypothetical protein